MDFVPVWYYDSHWSKVFISTHDHDLEVEGTDLNLNVKVFVKVFKTSLFPNLIIDFIHLWYDYTYWSNLLRSTIPTTQGHVKVKVTLRIFMLKFYIKAFRISLLLNYMTDLVSIWYHDRYWSKVFISTISTHDHDRDLEVEVTDIDFKC